jgi:Fe-S-cluster-containing hydrogenase component 2
MEWVDLRQELHQYKVVIEAFKHRQFTSDGVCRYCGGLQQYGSCLTSCPMEVVRLMEAATKERKKNERQM